MDWDQEFKRIEKTFGYKLEKFKLDLSESLFKFLIWLGIKKM